MIRLAIDPSTKSSGFAVFDDEKLVYYNCVTSSSQNTFKRIHKMAEAVDNLIQEYKPDQVIIEDVFPEDVRNNRSVFNTLMYLQGYIMEVLNNHNIKPKFVTASHWRTACGISTGRGIRRESLKPADVKFVKDQFGIDVNNDIADAIGIGFSELGIKPKKIQVVEQVGFVIE